MLSSSAFLLFALLLLVRSDGQETVLLRWSSDTRRPDDSVNNELTRRNTQKTTPNTRVIEEVSAKLRILSSSHVERKEYESLDDPNRPLMKPRKEKKGESPKSAKSEKLTEKSQKKTGKKDPLKKGKKKSTKKSKKLKKSDDSDLPESVDEPEFPGSLDDIDFDSIETPVDSTDPPAVFDFTVCDSFSNDWLFDLARTCDEDLEGCECATAENLIDEGIIRCATEDERFTNPPACPYECPICEFCMVTIGCEDIYDVNLS